MTDLRREHINNIIKKIIIINIRKTIQVYKNAESSQNGLGVEETTDGECVVNNKVVSVENEDVDFDVKYVIVDSIKVLVVVSGSVVVVEYTDVDSVFIGDDGPDSSDE